MPGESESAHRRGAPPPPLDLDDEGLFVDQHEPVAEDQDAGVKTDEVMPDSILTLSEELILFGPPPPSPRGEPTGRPRRTMATPVGFVPTTNDRYLNPLRERYVPPRDPFNSPFADIPFSAQTENYRAPRRRSMPSSGRRTSTVRRRSSGIIRTTGLPPLPRPLRYENPTSARPRIPSSSRPTPRSASASAASSSANKGKGSTSQQPTRKD